MGKTRVQICGITSVKDAVMACSAGADAIGLIFHPPASRGISMLTAEQVLASISSFVVPVGLFLDAPASSIVSVASRLHLRCIQLHGHESPADVKALAGYDVLKAVHVKPGRLRDALAPWREAVAAGMPNLKGLVLETGWVAAQGGSGVENDWEQIREVQDDGGFEGLPPIILAGGLHASNVGDVVELLRPYAVDVSSGVEEVKGRKSPERVADFMRAVRAADRNGRQAAALARD